MRKVNRPQVEKQRKQVMSFTIDVETAERFRAFTGEENGSIIVRAMMREYLDQVDKNKLLEQKLKEAEELDLN